MTDMTAVEWTEVVKWLDGCPRQCSQQCVPTVKLFGSSRGGQVKH